MPTSVWRRPTRSREDSICTHTILSGEAMVAEATHEDPRFAEVDALKRLDSRSYAGVRITDKEGRAIGAVYCTDGEPRRYTRTDLDVRQRLHASPHRYLHADAGDLDIRVKGLTDQPSDWTPVSAGT
ncbi:GAF domain-containing protein [Haloarcula sp. CBA1122]|nr:GAF domain-containing protein [Haloarcula sp. CBA1122]